MISASAFAVFSYLKRIGSSMDCGVFSETVARREAGNEPPHGWVHGESLKRLRNPCGGGTTNH